MTVFRTLGKHKHATPNKGPAFISPSNHRTAAKTHAGSQLNTDQYITEAPNLRQCSHTSASTQYHCHTKYILPATCLSGAREEECGGTPTTEHLDHRQVPIARNPGNNLSIRRTAMAGNGKE